MLDRLKEDQSKKASNLAVYQAVPPLYYAASAVKRNGTMSSTVVRDEKIAESYDAYIPKGFLMFKTL